MFALTALAALAGAGTTAAAWLLLLPWDLSEVDVADRIIDGGGDDNGRELVAVLALVVAMGVGIALVRARWAVPFTLAATTSYVVLFAWKVGGSRTIGANLWILPFVVVVLPAALASCALVCWVARQRW